MVWDKICCQENCFSNSKCMLFILMYQFCNVFFKNFSVACLLVHLMLYRVSILFDKYWVHFLLAHLSH